MRLQVGAFRLALQLPEGYACTGAGASDLARHGAWGDAGAWTFDGDACTFTASAGARLYAGAEARCAG